MCMTRKESVEIPQAEAYKVFTRNEKGQLQSAFRGAFEQDLVYTPDQRIRVNDEDACFFAFKDFQHALSIASDGIRSWNLVSANLIVLPVTLFQVITKGKFHVLSDDPQCMDGYYPAFEAKRSKFTII